MFDLVFIGFGLLTLLFAAACILRSFSELFRYLRSDDSVTSRTQPHRMVKLVVASVQPPHPLLLKFEQGYHFQGVYGSGAGVGASVWASGTGMAKMLIGPSRLLFETLEDKSCCDLGCGRGLVSIAAALAGARCVVATDGDAKLLPLTRRNINTNLETVRASGLLKACSVSGAVALKTGIQVAPLHWGSTGEADDVLRLGGFQPSKKNEGSISQL